MSTSNASDRKINIIETVQRLAGQRTLWEPLIRYDPVSRYYARLASEPQWEAWLLTWVPGQGTDWHDHGGSAGAFVTLQGTLTEQHAHVSGPAGFRNPPRIEPTPRELTAGSLRPFGRQHIHKVTNNALEPAVSLHVYAPALVEMNAYRELGDRLELVESQLVGVDW